MRRTPLMLLAAVALVPATIWTTTASASAASGSLTVTTYDRTGAKVSTPLSLTNIATNTDYTATSGKAKSLPKGTYTVVAAIATRRDSSDTVGARVLKVGSGKTTTTIDARAGKALKMSLDKPPAGQNQELRARICGGDTFSSQVEVYNSPGKIFVIPNKSKHLRSAFAASWSGQGSESWIVTSSSTTVPSSLTKSFKRSSLANLTAWARNGPSAGLETSIMLQAGGDQCRTDLSFGIYQENTPFTFKTHVSPGSWLVRADTWGRLNNGESTTLGFQWAQRTFTAGKSYTQTFFRSAWGPAYNVPRVSGGHLSFDTTSMFVDPSFGSQYYPQSEASEKSLVTLSLKGKVLKKQSRTDWGSIDTAWFEKKITKKGWYLLTVSAQRYRPGLKYPSGLLSDRTGVWFSFYADPKKNKTASVLLPRMNPAGLDIWNRAKPGSSTTVDIKLQGKATPKSVTAKASFDGGKSWKSVPVKKSGSAWKATVKNPGSGVVALKTQTQDKGGNKTEVTIYRAYRIG